MEPNLNITLGVSPILRCIFILVLFNFWEPHFTEQLMVNYDVCVILLPATDSFYSFCVTSFYMLSVDVIDILMHHRIRCTDLIFISEVTLWTQSQASPLHMSKYMY